MTRKMALEGGHCHSGKRANGSRKLASKSVTGKKYKMTRKNGTGTRWKV